MQPKLRSRLPRKTSSSPPVIIVDTREQRPWTFKGTGWCVKRKRLLTGDYTIHGLEDILRVKRKGNVEEMYQNVCTLERRKDLYEKFKRMAEFPCRMVVVEINPNDLSKDSRYCKMKAKNFLDNWLSLSLTFSVPLLCVGPRTGKQVKRVYAVFEKVWDLWVKGCLGPREMSRNSGPQLTKFRLSHTSMRDPVVLG